MHIVDGRAGGDHCLDLAEVFFGLAYALLGFAVIEGCLAFFSK